MLIGDIRNLKSELDELAQRAEWLDSSNFFEANQLDLDHERIKAIVGIIKEEIKKGSNQAILRIVR